MGNDRVGIRELRQYLSKYLRRVADGETLRVTDRGKPVAILAPLPETASPLARLIRSGAVRPANRRLEDLGPPDTVETSISVSEALERQRADH